MHSSDDSLLCPKYAAFTHEVLVYLLDSVTCKTPNFGIA